jgi:hypothetical protein
MSIIQSDEREDPLPARVIASPETLSDKSKSLHSPRRTRGGSMATILWALLLVFGILMLAARGPFDAPPFAQLTKYVCDPLPASSAPGTRQIYRPQLICRAGDKFVYQRQAVGDGTNPSGLKSCQREGGLTTIWRMAPHSAYGATVFHSTCGDQIMVLYGNRAAAYVATQRFVVGLACGIIGVSLWFLWRHFKSSLAH